jgi:hypothetical protein
MRIGAECTRDRRAGGCYTAAAGLARSQRADQSIGGNGWTSPTEQATCHRRHTDSEQPGGYSKYPWYAIRQNYADAIAATVGADRTAARCIAG